MVYTIALMENITDSKILELQKQFPSALGYLTSILLIQREKGEVGNARLAARLGVSKPAANQAMGRLKKLKLVEQDPYGTIVLTDEGRAFAASVLRRHYLIEHLLISKLGYPWEKSDDEAQRLQSSLSEEFTDYLYDYFGKPQTCPHGNPFPGSDMEEELINAPRLDAAPTERELRIIRITEEGESVEGLLLFCRTHDLMPGKSLCVKEISDDGVSALIGGAVTLIPQEIAGFLCYKEMSPQ